MHGKGEKEEKFFINSLSMHTNMQCHCCLHVIDHIVHRAMDPFSLLVKLIVCAHGTSKEEGFSSSSS